MIITLICINIILLSWLLYDVYKYWLDCTVLERIKLCKFNNTDLDRTTAFIIDHQINDIKKLEPEEFTIMFGEYLMLLDSLEDDRVKYIFQDYGKKMMSAHEEYHKNVL